MNCKVILPDTRPGDDDCGMERLQTDLLLWTRELFGERDTSWSICPPEVVGGIPHIFFLDDRTTRLVRINLGDGAEENWNIVLYQMAHEVIHLLNPRKGCKANNLEEGVASAFSYHVQELSGITKNKFVYHNHDAYKCVHNLVSRLPGGAIVGAHRIRNEMPPCSSFSSISTVNLERIFPGIDSELADTLTSEFDRNKTDCQ